MSELLFPVVPILVSALLFFGGVEVSYANEKATDYIPSQKNLLTDRQVRSLDDHAVKVLPECGFLYRKVPVGTVTGDAIYQCIAGGSNWFWSAGYKKSGFSDQQVNDFHGQFYSLKYPSGLPDEQLSKFHILDDYLGKRLLPYISALPKLDQAKLLRKIFIFYSDNLVFIKTMMDEGVLMRDVLLGQVGEGGNSWASCESYMLILNKNVGLYKDKKTLYEPISDPDEQQGIKPSYRWEDLHHLANPTYNVCPKAIDMLIQANSDLLNKRDSYDGATPLHLYLRGSFLSKPEDVFLIEKLTTSTNINMKSNDGNTPLHECLINTNPTNVESIKGVIEIMIARGANINIKNNEGVTAKEMILKRKELTGVLKLK